MHICKLRQDCQQKSGKSVQAEAGALCWSSPPPPDIQVLPSPGSHQACGNGFWLMLSRTEGFYEQNANRIATGIVACVVGKQDTEGTALGGWGKEIQHINPCTTELWNHWKTKFPPCPIQALTSWVLEEKAVCMQSYLCWKVHWRRMAAPC